MADNYDNMPGIRRSSLWVMNKSPLHFKEEMDNPPEQTPALVFGAAAHKYILERETFDKEFAVAPKVDRRTKQGKEDYAAFVAGLDGQAVIDEEDFQRIVDMAKAIDSHPTARKYLGGEHEKAFAWEDCDTGELCKCKADAIGMVEGRLTVTDYKTTDSCENGRFESSCRKYGYQFQAGMYSEGVFMNELERPDFVFVAQEKKPPYAVRVYFCDKGFVQQGYDKFRELIGLYHECKVSNTWPGYPDGELLEDARHE